MPFSSLISCLKFLNSNSCSGQSFLDCGQPSWIILLRLLSVGSDHIASLSSCSLVWLTGAICVMWCTGMTSMLDSLIIELLDCNGQTLLSASAITGTIELIHSVWSCTSVMMSSLTSPSNLCMQTAFLRVLTLVGVELVCKSPLTLCGMGHLIGFQLL